MRLRVVLASICGKDADGWYVSLVRSILRSLPKSKRVRSGVTWRTPSLFPGLSKLRPRAYYANWCFRVQEVVCGPRSPQII